MQVLVPALPLTCKLDESLDICEMERVEVVHDLSVATAVLGGGLLRLWDFWAHW